MPGSAQAGVRPNRRNFTTNRSPFVSSVPRPVLPGSLATGVMDRLFAGPTASEFARGRRLVRSKATGYTGLVIVGGLARVKLTGGCSSGRSTVTIADEIFPTLKQLLGVRREDLRFLRSDRDADGKHRLETVLSRALIGVRFAGGGDGRNQEH